MHRFILTHNMIYPFVLTWGDEGEKVHVDEESKSDEKTVDGFDALVQE